MLYKIGATHLLEVGRMLLRRDLYVFWFAEETRFDVKPTRNAKEKTMKLIIPIPAFATVCRNELVDCCMVVFMAHSFYVCLSNVYMKP